MMRLYQLSKRYIELQAEPWPAVVLRRRKSGFALDYFLSTTVAFWLRCCESARVGGGDTRGADDWRSNCDSGLGLGAVA